MPEITAYTANLIDALLEQCWTLIKGSGQPTHALRPAEDNGLTVWIVTQPGDGHLQLEADCRRLADGTVRESWKAEVFGTIPADALTAVAEANARHRRKAGTEPGALLSLAGWTPLPNCSRELATPDELRELTWIDDDMDEPNYWRIQRYDLQTEISASATTPAEVIAAFALIDAP
jgi:hypothetical protein